MEFMIACTCDSVVSMGAADILNFEVLPSPVCPRLNLGRSTSTGLREVVSLKCSAKLSKRLELN
eukprot:4227551-Pyramimonas_sp.AAC.1